MSKTQPLIAVVTGGSRGAGRGVAIALGRHGCKVYITGRTTKTGEAPLPGTIYETAEAVTAAGGEGIGVQVDHSDDAQVKAFFDRIQKDEGRLDILVNNAAMVHSASTEPGNFWEKPVEVGDLFDVGLRSSYVATYYAVPMMIAQGSGLIAFTSSSGAAHYMLGPAYGAHKAGMDKLAADMAIDLEGTGVSTVSIWMGGLLTERVLQLIESNPEKFGPMKKMMETPELTGEVIWSLVNDSALSDYNGKTVIGADMAKHYGIREPDGHQPKSYRELYGIEPHPQYDRVVR